MSGLETTLLHWCTQKIIDTEGRVERFLRKYGMMEADELQADELSLINKGDQLSLSILEKSKLCCTRSQECGILTSLLS